MKLDQNWNKQFEQLGQLASTSKKEASLPPGKPVRQANPEQFQQAQQQARQQLGPDPQGQGLAKMLVSSPGQGNPMAQALYEYAQKADQNGNGDGLVTRDELSAQRQQDSKVFNTTPTRESGLRREPQIMKKSYWNNWVDARATGVDEIALNAKLTHYYDSLKPEQADESEPLSLSQLEEFVAHASDDDQIFQLQHEANELVSKLLQTNVTTLKDNGFIPKESISIKACPFASSKTPVPAEAYSFDFIKDDGQKQKITIYRADNDDLVSAYEIAGILSHLPDDLRESIQTIYIEPAKSFNSYGEEVFMQANANEDRCEFSECFSKYKEDLYESMIHEVGHLFTPDLSEGSDWDKAWQVSAPVSRYGETNSGEYFAEMFDLYMLTRDQPALHEEARLRYPIPFELLDLRFKGN